MPLKKETTTFTTSSSNDNQTVGSGSASKSKIPLPFRILRAAFPYLEFGAQPLANALATRLFFTPLKFPVPEKEKAWLSKTEKHSFQLNGKQVSYYTVGTGKPVLLVHGWASRASQLYVFAEKLVNEGYQVLAFDAPAHGASEGKSTDVIEFGECILELKNRFPEINAIICHSLGGSASIYAIMQKLVIDKLVIIATPAYADDIIRVYRMRINGSRRIGDAMKRAIKKKYKMDFSDVTAPALAAQLTMPETLLIYDEDDMDAPPHHATLMKEAIPDAEVFKTKNLGHTRIIKDKDVVQKAVAFIC